MEAKLYYEAHITIEPVFDSRRDFVEALAKDFGFKLAELLMQKRKNDSVERSKNDTFMTGHSKNYQDLQNRLINAVNALQIYGYKVWRYKIEDTLLDSRDKDELNLLRN